MEGDAIKELKDGLAKPHVLDVDGRPRLLAPAQWQEVKYQHPAIAPLVVGTLSGLIDYVKTDVDELAPECILLHVKDPGTVELRFKADDEATGYRRQTYVTASTAMVGGLPIAFGQYYDAEIVTVALQHAFVAGDDRDGLITMIAAIRENTVREVVDNGVAQQVNVAGGVTLVGSVNLPNPVRLRPYRTFREVEQPASLFVLRAKPAKEGDKPQLALFEADGGMWKLEAITNVATFLKAALGPDVAVIA